MMHYTEFVKMANKICTMKTLYVYGGCGIQLTENNKAKVCNAYSFNKNRKDLIMKQSDDTFGFDCSGLLKSILWGFTGKLNDTPNYMGGAGYNRNGVPDENANTMFSRCTTKSKDFSNVPVGAMLHNEGHCGIYIGSGYAVESTYRESDGVQRTQVKNIKASDNKSMIVRQWTEWGLLPYVDYSDNLPSDELNRLRVVLLNNIYEELSDAKSKGIF